MKQLYYYIGAKMKKSMKRNLNWLTQTINKNKNKNQRTAYKYMREMKSNITSVRNLSTFGKIGICKAMKDLDSFAGRQVNFLQFNA